MSEKISLETLLPVALELFKKAPAVVASTVPAKNEQQRADTLKQIADEFALFTTQLHKKLLESK